MKVSAWKVSWDEKYRSGFDWKVGRTHRFFTSRVMADMFAKKLENVKKELVVCDNKDKDYRENLFC